MTEMAEISEVILPDYLLGYSSPFCMPEWGLSGLWLLMSSDGDHRWETSHCWITALVKEGYLTERRDLSARNMHPQILAPIFMALHSSKSSSHGK